MPEIISEHALANKIDHTNLEPFAVEEDFRKTCDEAIEHGFKMVAINSSPVALCVEFLKDSRVHVGAAISFPLGQTTIETKIFEVQNAIKNGANEIDYVINIGELKNGNLAYIRKEMKVIVEMCKKADVLSKVILENCYLTKDEKVQVCEIAKEVMPDFVKTSTGFGRTGATVDDVKLMKEVVGNKVKVKAAGGIRDLDTALAMIAAGAERLGMSAGVKVMEEYRNRKGSL